MTGIPSPDIPAFWCFFVVLAVGSLVAWSKIRELSTYPDRWAFAATYQLLFAHLALPVLLFWFLDYVSVIQDTSLFAAVVVAAGYGQIFSGSVQGITLPGQVASLWSPFQTWVKAVADRIATKQKQYRDTFDQSTQREISFDRERLSSLEALVWVQVPPSALFDAQLRAVPRNATLERTRILWTALRQAAPENYGYLLYKQKIISRFRYWWWLKKGRAKMVAFSAGIGAATLLAFAGYQVLSPSVISLRLPDGAAVQIATASTNTTGAISPLQRIEFSYYQWRATKPNASKWDQFRTERFLHDVLEGNEKGANLDQTISFVAVPIARRLCFQDISSQQADFILGTLIGLHSKAFDTVVVPQLLACLRTRNADVRLRIHRTLQGLHRADYPVATVPLPADLTGWVPKQDEAPDAVETCVGAWTSWWKIQWGITSTVIKCEGNSVQAQNERGSIADHLFWPAGACGTAQEILSSNQIADLRHRDASMGERWRVVEEGNPVNAPRGIAGRERTRCDP